MKYRESVDFVNKLIGENGRQAVFFRNPLPAPEVGDAQFFRMLPVEFRPIKIDDENPVIFIDQNIAGMQVTMMNAIGN